MVAWQVFSPFPHPLHPDEDGDSGAMELANLKDDPLLQYVIKGKRTYPEIACNEFMYHKVATALGRYYDAFIRIRKETCRRFLGEMRWKP